MAEAKSQTLMRRLLAVAVLCLATAFAWADAHDWSSLGNDQKDLLAPWQAHWNEFPSERRRVLAQLAARHPANSLQYAQLKTEIAYYAALLEHERARILDRFRQFKNLPAEKQQEYLRQWQQYDSLPAEEKEAWRRLAQQRN